MLTPRKGNRMLTSIWNWPLRSIVTNSPNPGIILATNRLGSPIVFLLIYLCVARDPTPQDHGFVNLRVVCDRLPAASWRATSGTVDHDRLVHWLRRVRMQGAPPRRAQLLAMFGRLCVVAVHRPAITRPGERACITSWYTH